MAIKHTLKIAGKQYAQAYTRITSMYWNADNAQALRLYISTYSSEDDRKTNASPIETRPVVMIVDKSVEDMALNVVLSLGYEELKTHSHYENSQDA